MMISRYNMDPLDNRILYVAGFKPDGAGLGIYITSDQGDTWQNITGSLGQNLSGDVVSVNPAGNGKVFIVVNNPAVFNHGKVYYTDNDGTTWSELDYGQEDQEIIYSLLVNPHNLQEIWVTHGNNLWSHASAPSIHKSIDGGSTWNEVIGIKGYYYLLGASSDGKIFFCEWEDASFYYTSDGGQSFMEVIPDKKGLSFLKSKSIAIPGNDASTWFLPTGLSGILHTTNSGTNWGEKNTGITSGISLVTADPVDPSIIYAAACKSTDYGQTWKDLIQTSGIYAIMDDLYIDPTDHNTIWYTGDIPYTYKSTDGGDIWENLFSPDDLTGEFFFSSIYAMNATSDASILYVLNNGFGIARGVRTENNCDWKVLFNSEVDYTYTIALDPSNSSTIYSGYTAKPFQDKAMIRKSTDNGEIWTTVLEVDSAASIASVIVDQTNSNHVYATSTGKIGGAVWTSTDAGQNWNKTNDYFNFTTIHSYSVSGGDDLVAYAGVWGGGTYKTDNGGQTWMRLPGEETFSTAWLAAAPDNPDVVYAADRTSAILYKSEDGGMTWTIHMDAGEEFRRLMSVNVDPRNADIVYVSAMRMEGPGKLGAVFKIENGNPTDITGSIPRVPLNITIDPSDPQVLYAVLHESGIYKSFNGGSSWTEISESQSGLPVSGFNALYIDPGSSNTLYLIGGCDVLFSTFESAGLDANLVNGVYKSTDGGSTWQSINGSVLGSGSGTVKALAFYQDDSQKIYLATENGLYYSTDGGTNWLQDTNLPYTTLGGIAISENVIYAFTNGAGIFTGTIQPDHSISWDSDQKIIAEIYFAQLLKHPTNASVIYASGYPGGIFKSTDSGQTWHESNFGMASFKVDDPLRQGYYAIDLCQNKPDVLYLGLFGKGVYKSTNSAATWYPVNGSQWEMFGKKITSLAVDPSDENTVYVSAEDGVYQTTDGGTNWTGMNQGLISLDIKLLHLTSGGELLAGTRGYGIWRWSGGQWNPMNKPMNWGKVWPIWDDRPMYQYTSFLIHKHDQSRMLIGTFPQGIFKSTDGGQSFKESNVGWLNDGAFSLVSHPYNPDLVFAGTYNGINRSRDFGDHWETCDTGWPDEHWVFSIDFNPSNPDAMVACSKNGENEGTGRDGSHGTVMKSIDGGNNWFAITTGLSLDQEFYEIIIDHFNHNTYYLACQDSGVFISNNGGESWEAWNDGLGDKKAGKHGINVTSPLTISADHSILYFGTDASSIYRRMISPILPVNNLSGGVSNQTIRLAWQFDDLANNFSHYNVYRAGSLIEDVNQLTAHETIYDITNKEYADSTVQNGASYYYTVTTNEVSGYENNHVYVVGPLTVLGMSITTTILDTGYVSEAYSDTLKAEGGTG
ncbi:hypothetical protein HQ585_12685, partial [candidate division KSB1 bacterium]|nr:hypothetical protein [candidate division KSB1 bacterium]